MTELIWDGKYKDGTQYYKSWQAKQYNYSEKYPEYFDKETQRWYHMAVCHDIWDDIYVIGTDNKERVDFPTQKPESLVERVIRASSDEGDLVLDCFVGSGTTAAVAEKLGRRWIACDLSRFAIHTARKRLLACAGQGRSAYNGAVFEVKKGDSRLLIAEHSSFRAALHNSESHLWEEKMERSRVKSILLDAAIGFLALCLLIAILASTHLDNDLRIFLVVTAGLYFIAGLLRGRTPPVNPWLKGALVNAGGSVVAVIMSVTRMAFTAPGAIALFILASLLPAIWGVETRRVWARGSRRWALAQVILLVCAAVLAALTLIPSIAARMFTQPVDRSVPSFSFSTLDGRAVNSSELKGHVVVLTFWATWCAPA
jgi:hypothetical protein